MIKEAKEYVIGMGMTLKEYGSKLLGRRLTKTLANLVKKRQGKGGKDFNYVTRHTTFRWLDTHYPGLWSFVIKERFYDEKFDHYYVHGRLKISDPVTGFIQEFDDMGISEVKTKSSGGDVEQMYYKNACSDAFKRCAVQVGAYNDVYSEDDEGFTDMAQVDWEVLLKHIDKAKSKFTSEQIGNQLALVMFGTWEMEELLEAWDVT